MAGQAKSTSADRSAVAVDDLVLKFRNRQSAVDHGESRLAFHRRLRARIGKRLQFVGTATMPRRPACSLASAPDFAPAAGPLRSAASSVCQRARGGAGRVQPRPPSMPATWPAAPPMMTRGAPSRRCTVEAVGRAAVGGAAGSRLQVMRMSSSALAVSNGPNDVAVAVPSTPRHPTLAVEARTQFIGTRSDVDAFEISFVDSETRIIPRDSIAGSVRSLRRTLMSKALLPIWYGHNRDPASSPHVHSRRLLNIARSVHVHLARACAEC